MAVLERTKVHQKKKGRGRAANRNGRGGEKEGENKPCCKLLVGMENKEERGGGPKDRLGKKGKNLAANRVKKKKHGGSPKA